MAGSIGWAGYAKGVRPAAFALGEVSAVDCGDGVRIQNPPFRAAGYQDHLLEERVIEQGGRSCELLS
jgi:hypothetical protein